MTWDGKERRSVSDHDTLIELYQITKNHVVNFDEHKKEDNESFKIIRNQIGKHAMYIYIGLGIIGTLQFLLKH